MTYDELLTKIEQRYWKMFNHNSQDQTDAGIEHRTLIQNQYFTLRAVVELHNPVDVSWKNDGSKILCSTCSEGFDVYPCPTIQAIEKELK